MLNSEAKEECLTLINKNSQILKINGKLKQVFLNGELVAEAYSWTRLLHKLQK